MDPRKLLRARNDGKVEWNTTRCILILVSDWLYFSKHGINIYIYIYIYIYYTINEVPGFRSDSSLYCYRPVSYGQEMTTLIRQYERMTVNFNCWLYNTCLKVQNK